MFQSFYFLISLVFIHWRATHLLLSASEKPLWPTTLRLLARQSLVRHERFIILCWDVKQSSAKKHQHEFLMLSRPRPVSWVEWVFFFFFLMNCLLSHYCKVWFYFMVLFIWVSENGSPEQMTLVTQLHPSVLLWRCDGAVCWTPWLGL